jgi:acetyl-CoA synthetase
MSAIESHLQETRVFPPPAGFSAGARIASLDQYRALHRESVENPDAFWAREAGELVWQEPWQAVCEWQAPYAKWFIGGKLNVSENCLDRHVAAGRGDKPALLWEGEPGDTRRVTYRQLLEMVCRMANALKARGIRPGDRVLIYMPMVPEAVAAMLACARIGAVHSVVFGGFSADSIKDRLADSGAVA